MHLVPLVRRVLDDLPMQMTERVKRILVVEDDAAILGIVTDILVTEGYDVSAARDGEEALASLEHARPDVILLDRRMPIMNGDQFIARFRSHRHAEVPVLAFAAAREIETWSKEIGAVGFIAKPFQLEDLLAAVQRATASEWAG